MNDIKLKNWKKIRAIGKKNYVLKYGVLAWGIPTGLLNVIILHFLQPEEIWFIRPIVSLILFPLSGILFGIIMWNIMERKYNT